jgi:hypothetical protein
MSDLDVPNWLLRKSNLKKKKKLREIGLFSYYSLEANHKGDSNKSDKSVLFLSKKKKFSRKEVIKKKATQNP